MSAATQSGPDLWAAARDAGEATALDALPDWIVLELGRAFTDLAKAPAFSSDMVWDRLSMATREVLATHPNAVGAMFTALVRTGKIERTGATVRSQRKNARGRSIPLWRFRL